MHRDWRSGSGCFLTGFGVLQTKSSFEKRREKYWGKKLPSLPLQLKFSSSSVLGVSSGSWEAVPGKFQQGHQREMHRAKLPCAITGLYQPLINVTLSLINNKKVQGFGKFSIISSPSPVPSTPSSPTLGRVQCPAVTFPTVPYTDIHRHFSPNPHQFAFFFCR